MRLVDASDKRRGERDGTLYQQQLDRELRERLHRRSHSLLRERQPCHDLHRRAKRQGSGGKTDGALGELKLMPEISKSLFGKGEE